MTRPIKKRGWLAFTAELVTVSLGVFMGFQLTQWNEDRKMQNRAQSALIRLQIESEEIVRYFQSRVNRFENNNQAIETTVAALSEGRLDPTDAEDFAKGVEIVSIYPAISPPSGVYDELKNAGFLREIERADVSHALAEYYSELEFLKGQLNYFRQIMPQLVVESLYGPTPVYDPEDEIRVRLEFEFDSLVRDQTYVSNMVVALAGQRTFQTWRYAVLARAERLCRVVSAAVSARCAPLENLTSTASANAVLTLKKTASTG